MESVSKVFKRTGGLEPHAALRDINFNAVSGETIGIIGANGAGKTTLMRLAADISKPSEGTVSVSGSCAALLETGATFHPELTGRENIMFSGILLGLTHAQITPLIDEIITFSGVGDYSTQPMRTYSTGMRTRLGFAIATSMAAQILLLDEALEVGDLGFREAAGHKLKDLAASGKIILVSSHSMVSILDTCERTLWLHDGLIRLDGNSDEVVDAYLQSEFGLRNGVRDYRSGRMADDIGT